MNSLDLENSSGSVFNYLEKTIISLSLQIAEVANQAGVKF
jgi:hypothetical protein